VLGIRPRRVQSISPRFCIEVTSPRRAQRVRRVCAPGRLRGAGLHWREQALPFGVSLINCQTVINTRRASLGPRNLYSSPTSTYILARLQDCAASPHSAATFTREVAECHLSAVVAQETCSHFCATPRMSRGNKARISQRRLKTAVLSSLHVLGWSGITSRITSPWRAKRMRSVCAP